MLFMFCVCHAFASVHCCIVITCWERANLLAIVGDVKSCFCRFPIWYPGSCVVLIVSISDLCRLSTFIVAAYGISSPKVTYTYYTFIFCFLFMKSSMGG